MRGGEALRQSGRKFSRKLPEKGSCRAPSTRGFGVMGWSAGARPRPATVLAATRSASALLVESLYARCFVFLYIEDGVELRDLQQVVYFLVADLQSTAADTHLDWIAHPPDGRSGRVPFTGVVEQVGNRALQARGRGAHQTGLGVEEKATLRCVQAGALDRPGGGQIQAHVLHLDLLDLGLGQIDQIADQHRQLPQLRLRVGSSEERR